jgi:hypothetical protein
LSITIELFKILDQYWIKRMKSKLEIYALSVCFASVVCLVISTGIAGYALFEIFTPELTMNSYKYDRYQSNEAFLEKRYSCSKEDKETIKPSKDELTKQRLEAFSVEVKAETREGVQSLIRCFMFILVSCITLLIHWRIAQKSGATTP